jgi:glycosyltransferase involved in cell wall biosynthesis
MRCEKSINISVVIPSYKDRFLHKTIEDILENFTDSFEIIPVVDGYELDRQIIDDPRVKPIIL